MLTILQAPYNDDAAFSGRIRVSVPRMSVGESGATSLAMVLHELATNSVKYGALSAATGTLDVACVVDGEELVLIWTEHGGPRITVPPETSGYGSKMLMRSMQSQLNGSVTRDWSEDGAIVTLRIDVKRLAV